MKNKILFVIPARGGSKGIPHKNIKEFGGKPLIYYSIDLAREFADDSDICVSTDDEKIIEIVESHGLNIPFKRPEEYATDTATTEDVLLHALSFYEAKNRFYDTIILLQPTSPLRTKKNIEEALKLYRNDIDMVVSVKESDVTGVLCNDNEEGFVQLLFNKNQQRRQDIPTLYEYNGALYIINVTSLKKYGLKNFERKIKYVMSREASIDIDTPMDWAIAELTYKRLVQR